MAENGNQIEVEQPRRKLPQLPWEALPDIYKLGDNIDDLFTLYRGDDLKKFSGDIKPNATKEEIYDFLAQIEREAAKGSAGNLDFIIKPHLAYVHRYFEHTPFISTSSSLGTAKAFTTRETGKAIATLEVPVNRLIAIRHSLLDKNPLEVLVFGGVLQEEIKEVKPIIVEKDLVLY